MRRRQTVEVFSISALDLFASALGVFMIITFILFPYYKNKEVAERKLQAATQSLEKAQQQQRLATAAAEEAGRRARQAEDPNDVQLMQEAQKRLQAVQARLATLQGELNQLRLEAEAVVDFTILGLPTKAKSFVLVVDMSGSMKAYASIMVTTLDRIVHPLDRSAKLAMVGYQGAGNGVNLHYWPSQGGKTPIAMDGGGKQQAISFGQSLLARFNGGTPTLAALQAAMEYDVEAVILLSDGAPTDARADAIVEAITRANAGKKEIHTVAIGNYNKEPGLVAFLQDLARRNKGAFAGIAK